MEKEEVVRIAKQNLEEGERWHKKGNVREIVFGLNDGSISTCVSCRSYWRARGGTSVQ